MGCLKLQAEENYTTLKVVYSVVSTRVLGEQAEKNKDVFLGVGYRDAQSNGGINQASIGDGIISAITFPFEMAAAAYDFSNNYYDMLNANFKNSDKYFHSKANFQATHRGAGGQFFAEHFSNLREIWDQNIKGYPRSDSELDQKANLFGRTQTNFFAPYDYRDALKIYRPALLPTKY